eukprot:COSAG06_NODE_156_length_21863_cov_29.245405_14_plen_585_part_00
MERHRVSAIATGGRVVGPRRYRSASAIARSLRQASATASPRARAASSCTSAGSRRSQKRAQASKIKNAPVGIGTSCPWRVCAAAPRAALAACLPPAALLGVPRAGRPCAMVPPVRRALLLSVVLLGRGGLAPGTQSSTVDDSRTEWRQFQGGPARQGRLSNLVSGPSTNTTHQIIKLGNGSQSMAVVGANGTIFVPTENHLGEIKALDAQGRELWSYTVWSELHPTTERIISPPALSLDGRTLYVADAFYTVIALNATTGTQIWNVSTCIAGKIPNACGEIMGPLLLDDYGNALYFGASDGWLYKVNLNSHHHTSGNLVWYTFIGSERISGPSKLPLGHLGHVFATTDPNSGGDGTTHCIASGVGEIKWNADIGASISVPTVDQQGNVYFGSTRCIVYSYDTNGVQRWNYTFDRGNASRGFCSANTSPAIASDGSVFLTGCASTEPGQRGMVTCYGHLTKLNGTSGSVMWSTAKFHKTSRGFGGANAELGTPILAESAGISAGRTTVYLSHNDGTIYSVDGASGEILWSYDSGVAIGGYMSLASDGRLLVPTGGGPTHRPPGEHHRAVVNCSLPTACAILVFKG